jgi:energy-coupling factor transporter ATP-binding protein EcfA2
MEIEILNCNNIDRGTIRIEENKLNLKYALNGIGKSTIAKAIELHLNGDNSITALTPFKHIGSSSDEDMPAVHGLDSIETVAIFNDEYINQYAFKQDEVLTNSFEIFVKTPDYESRMETINTIMTEIKDTFKDSEDIDRVIGDLGILSDSFGKSKSGYSAAGALAKGIGKGNKISNVPKGLESYSAYLKSSVNAKWLRWQMDGNKNYSDISENCPYCTASTNEKKDTISQVSKEYDPRSVEHLNRIVTVLESLHDYFSEDANGKLNTITNNINGFSKEEINYLLRLKEQIDTLKTKMLDLKGLTFFSLKDVDKISDYFSSLKIDLSFLQDLDTEHTNSITQPINASLDKVLGQVGTLQGEVNQQNLLIQRTIENNKGEINEFLKYAGYKYQVDVVYDTEMYKMKLRHADFSETVPNGSQHLSYGERNAFSLILFMYECLAKKPDIIVLDDPVSSFDKNKKYAVIDMLFRGRRSLQAKTVLLMTHDLEPVIDILYNLPHHFDPLPSASFIQASSGILSEIPITRSDISTFAEVCHNNVLNSTTDIVKLVYLRRYYETLDNKGMPYQLVSSLFHKRPAPDKKINGETVLLTEREIEGATRKIQQKLPSFDYEHMLASVTDDTYMKEAYEQAEYNHEKLQIFRIMKDSFPNSKVINKFINETFHIENEYIMQINPRKYEVVPSYIVDECNSLVLGSD